MPCSLNESLGFLVNSTANAMKKRFNTFLKPYTLTVEQFVILQSILENPLVTQTQLAEHTSKDKTTLTRMLDTLQKNDLIIKKTQEGDKRAYVLSLSQKASDLMEEILPQMQLVHNNMQQHFTQDEIKTFTSVLHRLKTENCLEKL